MKENLKNLPPISEVIKFYDLKPDKRLGQNFLSDQDITDKIVHYAGSLKDKTVLEVGPGPGLLTRSLLYTDAKKIFAVEMDPRCIKALKVLGEIDQRLSIINHDALTLDEATLTSEKLTVIANLPYNIGTSLLLKWFENINKFNQIIVMLQKEVVERLIATPDDEHYGRLSIICNLLCDAEYLFDIDPENFYPAPKVVSTVVRLIPLSKPRFDCNVHKLSNITKAAFGQRRKMLRSSLKSIFNNPTAELESIGIDPSKRAEELSVEDFCKISNLLSK